MHADWAELTFELAEWKATGLLLSSKSLVPELLTYSSFLKLLHCPKSCLDLLQYAAKAAV